MFTKYTNQSFLINKKNLPPQHLQRLGHDQMNPRPAAAVSIFSINAKKARIFGKMLNFFR